jgi:hypothetical protein
MVGVRHVRMIVHQVDVVMLVSVRLPGRIARFVAMLMVLIVDVQMVVHHFFVNVQV